MTNSAKNSRSNQVSASAKETPWWNRPVTGEGGLLKDLLNKIEKEELPEAAIALRNLQLLDMRVFVKTAEAIDSDKFGNEEFLTFVRLEYMLSQGIGDYAELNESVRLLQLAIAAKDSFIAINQTELRYRGYKQQEFYSFVDDLLKEQQNSETFREKVNAKALEILTQVKTEEGQGAIKAYAKHIDKIAKNPLGLKLLFLFKRFNLVDYSVLRTISEGILSIETQHIHDQKKLINIVNQNHDAFTKLRNIIQLPTNRNSTQVYALMIQIISLAHQYEATYLRFYELMKIIKKWHYNYQVILQLYQDYPASQYKLPKDFSEPILGEALYLKYRKLLTDKKTGMVYMDLS